jgi:uncharacterized peroxidase-related enzyme
MRASGRKGQENHGGAEKTRTPEKQASNPKPVKASRATAAKATGTPAKVKSTAKSPNTSTGKPAGTSAAKAAPQVAASTRGRDDLPAIALGLAPAELDAPTQAYFDKCMDKIGFVPNVLAAYAFDMAKLSAFSAMYNDLMLAPSGLTKLEREMIAVAVSSVNRCYYCLTAHGAAVRQLSGDPVLGEQMVMNYRAARLDGRQRAMLDFAIKLTERPHEVEEADRDGLRRVGFSERDIWDIAAVTAFFNMSNRIAAATDMRPNEAYHAQARTPAT